MTEVVALLDELIRINSASPDLEASAPGEAELAASVSAWLEARGFVCRLVGPPGRPSVVGVHAGGGGGRSLMLNGHLDTVALASYDGDALEPRHVGGTVRGRGAYDMKSGLAAMMCAAAVAASRPHRGDIVLALVADEEFASRGTEEVLRHVRADGAIVCEPTEQELVVAHRGFAWFTVTVHGRAAHGSRRDLGVDAIVKAGPVLVALGAYDLELAGRTPHPLLGTANVHASLISGGVEASSYPASCTLTLERRTLPGEDAALVEGELRLLLDAVADGDPEFAYTLEPGLSRNPFAVDAAASIPATVAAAHRSVVGKEVVVRGEAFWTDAALLADAGIPAVLYGVRGGGAHAADEWVEIDSLVQVTAVLTEIISEFTA